MSFDISFWIFALALVAGLVVLVVGRSSPPNARRLLAERLARGELTPSEYRERLSLLGGNGRPAFAIGVTLVAIASEPTPPHIR